MPVLVRFTAFQQDNCISNTSRAVVKNVAAHHAISAKFPKPVDNKGKTLVVQYEVKLQGMFYPTIDLSFISRADISSRYRRLGMWWGLS